MKTNKPTDDAPLNALLEEWKVKPSLPPRFREQVWRRVERAGAATSPSPTLATVFGHWISTLLPRPALAAAYLTVLLAIGAGVGWNQARQESARVTSHLNGLMERHNERFFHYLYRSLQNEEDAADLAQEAFARVYQHRSKFETGQKFSTWLYAIASNLVKDRYRWRSRHPPVSLDAQNDRTGDSFRDRLPGQLPTLCERLQADERTEAVRRAVASLPEELRQPLILAEYDERSHAEIGGILSCSPQAVESRIYRARQQLRASLAGLLEPA